MRYGFVIDQTTCIGCHACTVACKTEHQVPLGVNRTWVKYVEQGTWPDTHRSFSVMRCNHCTDAPCVTICPTSALFKRKDGIVDFDTSHCIGCKSCMQACPYDALYIDPDEHTAQKCNYCAHRVEVGIEPACVVVCPEQAIVAGDLDDATTRIAQMVAAGDLDQRSIERGTNPNLWYMGAEQANIKPLGARRPNDGGIWRDPGTVESWLSVDLTTGPNGDRTGIDTGGVVTRDGVGAPRIVYSNDFPMPWGWRVSSYFLTKAVSAGIAIAAAIALLFGARIDSMWMKLGAPVTGGIFLLLTGLLLITDLKRPDRFLYLLRRGNPSSWLVRGAWILSAQAALFALWFLAALSGGSSVARGAIWLSALTGLATAGYTAFLFAQARGRVLWGGEMLVWHMIAAAFAVGGGASLIASLASVTNGFGLQDAPLTSATVPTGTFAFALIMLLGSLALGLLSAIEPEEYEDQARQLAHHHMTQGAFASMYRIGLVLAVAVPAFAGVAVVFGAPVVVGAIGGVSAMAGVWLVDNAFVKAGQSVPLT